ncbi:3-vinyl bacteriochlorophyllide hydratase [Rhodopseudomonas rhenobacensis]|uniref:3-vinyl bacteriochlorophyllide hydratase n=1 Tax=Rhodopseudomonas rhenobacensis TaxID=87461 RepID=A0A7W7Z886_9BRAD|nr:3-vinyl bacteriochlorophyllide hydratase [Rhodopseudomonas rhenobacensis]
MHRQDDSEQDQVGGGERPSLSVGPVSHHRDAPVSNTLYNPVSDLAARGHATAAAEPHQEPVTHSKINAARQGFKPLYTPEQRIRRDATKWTLVQGILAPIQFLIFLISLALVIRYLVTGDGFAVATTSVVIKTLVLYTIMITGAIWEREVFGCYLFAPAFFWEDVFSFLVLALHTAYLVMLFGGLGDPQQQMFVALAAYASYVINATQFILKLRAARLDERNKALAVSTSGSRV